jgi:very-short-patch-repair endonuclease
VRDDELNSRKFARRLRKEMTAAEVILWAHIRRYATGWRFRRQHPIGPYVADFACVIAKLVVEVDGATHGADEASRDAVRTRHLEAQGWAIIRFSNTDIYRDLDGVWRKIVEVLGPSPAPIPRLRRVLPPQAGEEN